MSVYTTVGHAELAAWLKPLAVGALQDHAGISAGMQNSNYFVTTTEGRFVLTLFEAIEPGGLDFYLRLQSHLADHGMPCPRPMVDAQGQRWRMLNGKPAALLTCLPGRAVEQPTQAHCRAVGEALARLHLAASDLSEAPANPCGADWCKAVAARLLPLLDPGQAALLADELAFQAAQDRRGLPQGIVHADLFRDNVLWNENGQIGGLLDFYFAGVDAWLFDLAVVANDWCPDAATLQAMLDAYAAIRPLTLAERQAWTALRRAAALRFWLLRLEASLLPKAGEVVTVKNPDEFRHLLEQFRLAPDLVPG